MTWGWNEQTSKFKGQLHSRKTNNETSHIPIPWEKVPSWEVGRCVLHWQTSYHTIPHHAVVTVKMDQTYLKHVSETREGDRMPVVVNATQTTPKTR